MTATTNYSMFKFREDNREQDPSLVRALIKSISANNMLKYKPIIVNDKFEIMDGQHRFLAAQELNVPIFYIIEKKMTLLDMIGLQTQKHWRTADYVNAFAKNGYVEYQKFLEFTKKNQLSIVIALSLIKGRSKGMYDQIRSGNFKFINNDILMTELEYCNDIQEFLKQQLGSKLFLNSTRFWRAMVHIVRHPIYNHDKMMKNLSQLISKFSSRADYEGYRELFVSIHNFRNQHKINLKIDEDDGDDE